MSTNLEAKVTRNRSWFAKRRVWCVLLVLFVLFLVFLYFGLLPSRLIISPETTLITKLKPDGKPDYVGTFMLEHNGQLTNPDDNGLRMVVEKFGPYVLARSSVMKGCTWEDLPADSTDAGKWYRKEWIPLCNAMSIDPTKKPIEYKPIRAKLRETEKAKYKEDTFQTELTTNPWRAEDYPDIVKFVEEAEEALAVYSIAAKKTQWVCYRSVDNSLIGILSPDVQSVRDVCNDFAIRANERISRNDISGAFDDAVSMMRIGRHLENASNAVERLIGFSVEELGINVIQSILTHCNPNAEQIRQFISELEKLKKYNKSLDNIIKLDKMMFLEILFACHRMKGDNFSYIANDEFSALMWRLSVILPVDYNVASKRLQAHFIPLEKVNKEHNQRKRIDIIHQAEVDLSKLAHRLRQPQEAFVRMPAIWHRSTLLADYVCAWLMPAYRSFFYVETRLEVRRDLLRVSLALELYQRENGHYPDKLESIAPKYIDAIPEDQFTSKELTYKKIDNGYILYSFGQNKIDDGGDNTKDITVERTRDLNE
ncbi:MAG: hypothetical protein LBQ66_13790 [Planctomycetaceae bacterium]|jgi:hypothetical protein|nr:hypothetical protein [Planctomycetaceae bacterium]